MGYSDPPGGSMTQDILFKKSPKVSALCKELGITRQTLYRHVGPQGELRPDGHKLLGARRVAEGGAGPRRVMPPV
jgi:hypothetical protein